jgi:hypothetical protein
MREVFSAMECVGVSGTLLAKQSMNSGDISLLLTT